MHNSRCFYFESFASYPYIFCLFPCRTSFSTVYFTFYFSGPGSRLDGIRDLGGQALVVKGGRTVFFFWVSLSRFLRFTILALWTFFLLGYEQHHDMSIIFLSWFHIPMMTIEESCCRLGWQGFPSYFWRRKKESGWSIYDDLPFFMLLWFFFLEHTHSLLTPLYLPALAGTGVNLGDTHTRTNTRSLSRAISGISSCSPASLAASSRASACMCLISFPFDAFSWTCNTALQGREDMEESETGRGVIGDWSLWSFCGRYIQYLGYMPRYLDDGRRVYRRKWSRNLLLETGVLVFDGDLRAAGDLGWLARD